MFSGITRGLFPVTFVDRKPGLLKYAVGLSPELSKQLEIGASIAVNGVCQTVVEIQQNVVYFDAIQETLNKTTLADLEINTLVSIERSLHWGDEVGGHLVSGHVSGTGVIVKRIQEGDIFSLTIECHRDWMKYISPKGFIAIDGSSLTIGDTDIKQGLFDIHLIPETLRVTQFAHKKLHDRVNIELDSQTKLIVDTVERYFRKE